MPLAVHVLRPEQLVVADDCPLCPPSATSTEAVGGASGGTSSPAAHAHVHCPFCLAMLDIQCSVRAVRAAVLEHVAGCAVAPAAQPAVESLLRAIAAAAAAATVPTGEYLFRSAVEAGCAVHLARVVLRDAGDEGARRRFATAGCGGRCAFVAGDGESMTLFSGGKSSSAVVLDSSAKGIRGGALQELWLDGLQRMGRVAQWAPASGGPTCGSRECAICAHKQRCRHWFCCSGPGGTCTLQEPPSSGWSDKNAERVLRHVLRHLEIEAEGFAGAGQATASGAQQQHTERAAAATKAMLMRSSAGRLLSAGPPSADAGSGRTALNGGTSGPPAGAALPATLLGDAHDSLVLDWQQRITLPRPFLAELLPLLARVSPYHLSSFSLPHPLTLHPSYAAGGVPWVGATLRVAWGTKGEVGYAVRAPQALRTTARAGVYELGIMWFWPVEGAAGLAQVDGCKRQLYRLNSAAVDSATYSTDVTQITNVQSWGPYAVWSVDHGAYYMRSAGEVRLRSGTDISTSRALSDRLRLQGVQAHTAALGGAAGGAACTPSTAVRAPAAPSGLPAPGGGSPPPPPPGFRTLTAAKAEVEAQLAAAQQLQRAAALGDGAAASALSLMLLRQQVRPLVRLDAVDHGGAPTLPHRCRHAVAAGAVVACDFVRDGKERGPTILADDGPRPSRVQRWRCRTPGHGNAVEVPLRLRTSAASTARVAQVDLGAAALTYPAVMVAHRATTDAFLRFLWSAFCQSPSWTKVAAAVEAAWVAQFSRRLGDALRTIAEALGLRHDIALTVQQVIAAAQAEAGRDSADSDGDSSSEAGGDSGDDGDDDADSTLSSDSSALPEHPLAGTGGHKDGGAVWETVCADATSLAFSLLLHAPTRQTVRAIVRTLYVHQYRPLLDERYYPLMAVALGTHLRADGVFSVADIVRYHSTYNRMTRSYDLKPLAKLFITITGDHGAVLTRPKLCASESKAALQHAIQAVVQHQVDIVGPAGLAAIIALDNCPAFEAGMRQIISTVLPGLDPSRAVALAADIWHRVQVVGKAAAPEAHADEQLLLELLYSTLLRTRNPPGELGPAPPSAGAATDTQLAARIVQVFTAGGCTTIPPLDAAALRGLILEHGLAFSQHPAWQRIPGVSAPGVPPEFVLLLAADLQLVVFRDCFRRVEWSVAAPSLLGRDVAALPLAGAHFKLPGYADEAALKAQLQRVTAALQRPWRSNLHDARSLAREAAHAALRGARSAGAAALLTTAPLGDSQRRPARRGRPQGLTPDVKQTLAEAESARGQGVSAFASVADALGRTMEDSMLRYLLANRYLADGGGTNPNEGFHSKLARAFHDKTAVDYHTAAAIMDVTILRYNMLPLQRALTAAGVRGASDVLASARGGHHAAALQGLLAALPLIQSGVPQHSAAYNRPPPPPVSRDEVEALLEGLAPYQDRTRALLPAQEALVREALLRYGAEGDSMLQGLPTLEAYIITKVLHGSDAQADGAVTTQQLRYFFGSLLRSGLGDG